jgi:AraC family transcriptional regulator, positive regulator of tynA and feaB
MESMMHQSGDGLGTPRLDFDAWGALLRSNCGGEVEVTKPHAFAGWMRPLTVCGLVAAAVKIEWGDAIADVGRHTHRVERTHRNVRRDGVDHHLIVYQVAGQSALTQNDQSVQLAAGDVALVDAARPVTYFTDYGSAQWLALRLPRQSVLSHLGFELQGGIGRHGARAGRLLFDLIRDSDKGDGPTSSRADSYLQLAVYDLVGALFAPSDWPPVSRRTDKLFARIRRIIKERFADSDFGPVEVAAEAGVSLRYVQKLCTERGTTCSEFIYSLRLDHAALLVRRRALLGASQPLSDIAYACGFRDYTHFARKFRQRFGCAPGTHAAPHDRRAGNASVHASTGESASQAHDVQPPAI